VKIKVEGINLTYEGLIPQDPEVDPVQGPSTRCSRTCGRSSSGRHLCGLPGVRRHAAERGSAVLPDRGQEHRRGLQAMQISDLAEWVR
jgi:hypothetical protein